MPDRKPRAVKAKAPRAEKAKAVRPEKPKAMRTAGGNKASPELLAEASRGPQEGYRERTEAEHRAAGRTPPSERTPGVPTTRRGSSTAIRSYMPAHPETKSCCNQEAAAGTSHAPIPGA
jgi:hypothetical protein